MWEQVKMPNRHFLRSDIFTFVMVYYFYFLLVGSRRNECNSLWEQLRGRRQMSITTQKVFLPGIFTCSHITFAMVYSFYFLLVGSRRNECNSFWGEKGERSGVCYLLSSLCWTFFQVSLMIRWYCKLSLYMINLSLYCRDISFVSMYVMRYMIHIS